MLAPPLTGEPLAEPTDILSTYVFCEEVVDRLQALEHATVAGARAGAQPLELL